MYGSLDVSTSGLIAQRTRLDVISANLANRQSILNANGEYEPYRRRFAVLAHGGPDGGPGVRVDEIQVDEGPLEQRYEPWSPYADAEGYVGYPNVNPIIEQIDAMQVQRAYEANITAAEATKQMMQSALSLLA